MNERSPVGMGRSLTGVPHSLAQGGQLTRDISQGLVEIGRTLGQVGDAVSMRVEGQVVGKALGDGETVGKERGRQLSSDLSAGKGAHLPIPRADATAQPGLPRAIGLYAYSFKAPAVAGRYVIFVEPSSKELLIFLDRDGQMTAIDAVREIKGVGVERDRQAIPGGDAIEIIELRTARSVFWRAHETNRAAEGETLPVALLERDVVDSTETAHPGRNNSTGDD